MMTEMDTIVVDDRRRVPIADLPDTMIECTGRHLRASSLVEKDILLTNVSSCVQHVDTYTRVANAPWKNVLI